MNRARRALPIVVSVVAVLTLLASAGSSAQQNQEEKKHSKFADFAGTVLGLAAMNYSGPHQQLAQSVVTLFNGGAPQSQQAAYDPDDPYGVYDEDVYVVNAEYGADDASGYESEYMNPGSYPAGAPSIDAGLVGRAADGSLQIVETGATLHGPSPGYPGDRVGVAFAPAYDAYVYVVAFDSTGWIQGLYPDPALGHRNPVPAGQEVLLPGDALFGLDNVTGVETIYVLASNSPRPDVESQLASFFGKERPPGASAVYRSVERPIIIARGLTGLRPASVNQAGYAAAGDSSPSIVMDSFLATDDADELVITLWFNHQ